MADHTIPPFPIDLLLLASPSTLIWYCSIVFIVTSYQRSSIKRRINISSNLEIDTEKRKSDTSEEVGIFQSTFLYLSNRYSLPRGEPV